MPIIRALVTFEAQTGIPKDAATNTFHFDADNTSGGVLGNIMDLLEDFYTDIPTGGASSPILMMANGTWGNEFTIQLYNLSDPIPRFPIADRTVAGTGGTTDGMPTEVSLVMSFQGNQVAGVPQSRRRGRIFLPFIGKTRGSQRPSSATVADLARAGKDLLDSANASINVQWVVWSPTTSTSVAITNGWVDDSWDTQRRRGYAPSSRSTFS